MIIWEYNCKLILTKDKAIYHQWELLNLKAAAVISRRYRESCCEPTPSRCSSGIVQQTGGGIETNTPPSLPTQ